MNQPENHIIKDGLGWYVLYGQLGNQVRRVDGPVCNKCLATLSHTVTFRKYKCPKCSKEYSCRRDIEEIKRDARSIAEGLVRKNFVTKKLYADVTYVETATLKAGDQWLQARLAMEGEVPGDLHIFVGSSSAVEGEKTHIIVSPAGDLRVDSGDVDPVENVSEVSVEVGGIKPKKSTRKTKFLENENS